MIVFKILILLYHCMKIKEYETLQPVILSIQYDHLTPEEARELLDEAIKNHDFFSLVE